MRTKIPCPICGTPHTTHGLIFYKGEQMCHKCSMKESTRMPLVKPVTTKKSSEVFKYIKTLLKP